MDSAKLAKDTDQRLVCVDALRGFDMLWIIGGSGVMITLANATGWSFLSNMEVNFDHQWGQFHFYDLIMPLFLFIVGVVMPITIKKRLARGETKKNIYKHVIKRVVLLYILGLISSGHILTFDVSKMHIITNTLHAIAVGYAVGTIMILELKIKWQLGVTAALLLLYWAIMALIPIPGNGAGKFDRDVNLALYVDNAILGHFQEGEGWTYIISNITFICSVMLGVFAGNVLQSDKSQMKKVGILALIAVCCIIVGKVWGIWLPIIHHIWTSTLVLFAGGLSFLLLALFYLVIDVWGYKKWTFPFVVIGMNAIAVYVATDLFDFGKIGNVFVGGLAKHLGLWGNFLEAFGALAVVWLILYYMYRNKTFLKV